MSSRAIAATVAEIVSYWSTRQDECGLAVDWADAHDHCWRCGSRTAGRLQRCHITPRSLGGSASPDNLVLLCARCHREAPNVSGDPEAMWIWMRAEARPFYDTFWVLRAFEQFRLMYRREPRLDYAPELITRALHELQAEGVDSAVHFGDGWNNPATTAAILRALERHIEREVAQ